MLNQLFGRNFCIVQEGIFYLNRDYEQLSFLKSPVLPSLVAFSDTGKSQFVYNWPNLEPFNQNLTKFTFSSTVADTLWCYAKKIENLEFVQGVNSELLDPLKNNGTKHLWIFDVSCEEICNSKAFNNIAIARRHRGLGNIYIKHNLFHQSKLGRDVQLHKTHIVFFKSPRYVRQVSTLSAPLRLGSELIDWFRDATSVPFGHFRIVLSPRTDHQSPYRTNTWSIPSKIFIPDRLIHLKSLDGEHRNYLYPPSVQFNLPQLHKFFSYAVKRTEKNYPVSLRIRIKSAEKKAAKHKKISRDKTSIQASNALF